jgi:hypothetical protein
LLIWYQLLRAYLFPLRQSISKKSWLLSRLLLYVRTRSMLIVVFWSVMFVALHAVTIISEECTAFIFREAMCSSKTLVTINKTTRFHNPEDPRNAFSMPRKPQISFCLARSSAVFLIIEGQVYLCTGHFTHFACGFLLHWPFTHLSLFSVRSGQCPRLLVGVVSFFLVVVLGCWAPFSLLYMVLLPVD